MTARRVLAHTALGAIGGALAVIATGITITVADWQHKNHIAARRGRALHRKWTR